MENLGSTSETVMTRVVPFAYQNEASIKVLKRKEIISVEALRDDWQEEIIDYLERLELPKIESKQEKLS